MIFCKIKLKCVLNFIYKFLSKIVSEGFNVVLLFGIVKCVCIGERKFFGEKDVLGIYEM